MHRETGGCTTLLGKDLIFSRIGARRGNPAFPTNIGAPYELAAGGCVDTYRDLCDDASFRWVNDVITGEGRRLPGLGRADSGECMVFAGKITPDFDYRSMVSVFAAGVRQLEELSLEAGVFKTAC